MTYYADLTPYEYFPNHPEALNVGWLGLGHPFPMDPFVYRLERLCEKHVEDRCRGSHTCEFCSKVSGNGSIRVVSKTGKVYIAPVLISHYVKEHNYSPPQEFIEAVLSDDRA